MNKLPSASLAPPLKPPRPKAAHNIFWLITERGLKAVGGVGIAVLIARHLGPGHYGSYGAAIGLATLAKEAVMLGFDRMIRRDLAARPNDAGKIIGTSVALSLAISFVVAFGLSALAGHLVDDEETRRLTLIVVWMAVPSAFYSCEIWFESSGEARPLVWTRNVVWLLFVIGRLVLVLIGSHVTAFATLALVEWAVTYAAVCGLLRKVHRHDIHFAFDPVQFKAWFREGWPAVLMIVIGSTADRIMVLLAHNLSSDNAEAGYLNAAIRIAEIWWSMSTIVAAILLPRIVALQKSDPVYAAKATQLYANTSLLVGVGAAVAMTLTAPWIVPWLFGSAYAPSALVLVILFWSGPAIFPGVARSQLWVIRGQLILDLPTVCCVSICQLSLVRFLVPRYGAVGAALSMTTAQWVGVYGLTLCVPALRRASQTQLHAFRALFSPGVTIRGMYGFVAKMVGK
jgi:PST family polysaccharide transporter